MARLDDSKTMLKGLNQKWLEDELDTIPAHEARLDALGVTLPNGRGPAIRAQAQSAQNTYTANDSAIDGATTMEELQTAWASVLSGRPDGSDYKNALGPGFQIP